MIRQADRPSHELKLHIAVCAPRSLRAMEDPTTICREYPKGRRGAEGIDLLQGLKWAGAARIIATFATVGKSPESAGKGIGTLSDFRGVPVALDRQPA